MIFYKKIYSKNGVRGKFYRKSLKYKGRRGRRCRNSTHYHIIKGGEL